MPERERTRRVDAVIIRHQRWGEADRLLTIYARELGKVRAIAKGVRKTRSRKAGHLEPFMRSALMLAQGRDLWIVSQADTIDAFLPLRDDLQKTGYAAYVLELLDRFTYDDGPNPNLYRLLVETLERLAKDEPVFVVLHFYEFRLLDMMGFRPQLFDCISCGETIKAEDQYFSALQGGVLCPRCGHRVEDSRRISMDALKFLRHFQRSSYAQALAARPVARVEQEVETIMQWYLTFLLERNINSQAFIREVRKGYAATNPDKPTGSEETH
jgi:DNA repair protein RecO (recombination protein O)